jgi:hypothetical protein
MLEQVMKKNYTNFKIYLTFVYRELSSINFGNSVVYHLSMLLLFQTKNSLLHVYCFSVSIFAKTL